VRVIDILRALLRFLGRSIYVIVALVVVLWLLSALAILLPLPVLGMFQFGPICVYSFAQPVAQKRPGVYG
jgi:hypothetical protein